METLPKTRILPGDHSWNALMDDVDIVVISASIRSNCSFTDVTHKLVLIFIWVSVSPCSSSTNNGKAVVHNTSVNAAVWRSCSTASDSLDVDPYERLILDLDAAFEDHDCGGQVDAASRPWVTWSIACVTNHAACWPPSIPTDDDMGKAVSRRLLTNK